MGLRLTVCAWRAAVRLLMLFIVSLAATGGIPLSAQPSIDDEVEKRIRTMSDDEKIAQLLFVGFDGRTMTAELRKLVAERKVGGIVLFASNLESPAQVRRLTTSIRDAGGALPPFIATDEEGGIVKRLRFGVPVLPSAMALGATRSPELARRAGEAVGAGLRDLGFTMNFAPVLDVLSEPENLAIGTRSFGSDPALVATIGTAYIKGQLAAGIIPVAKHFPGVGGVVTDTHDALPVLNIDRAAWERRDLVPFRDAIRKGLPALMTGHIAMPRITGSDLPATLSKEMMSNILRKAIGFDGIAISDALQMKALRQSGEAGQLALAASLAGSDMVLALGSRSERDAAFSVLREAYGDGRLPRERVHVALRRILRLKLQQRERQAPTENGQALMDEIAARAITIVGRTDLLPMSPTARATMVYVGPQGALSGALDTRSVHLPAKLSAGARRERVALAMTTARGATLIVTAATNAAQFDAVRDLRKRLPKVPMIFVNLGSPHRVLDDAASVTIFTYSDHEASQKAAAALLLSLPSLSSSSALSRSRRTARLHRARASRSYPCRQRDRAHCMPRAFAGNRVARCRRRP